MRETGYINGLRALAAFCVLTCHCMIWSRWPGTALPLLPRPGLAAKLAVDLFMIISGFLMVLNAQERERKEPLSCLQSWYKFYLRRFFRIAPAYYLSLFVAVLLQHQFLAGYVELAARIPGMEDSVYCGANIQYSAPNILIHVSFLFGFLPNWAYSTQLPDWSLALEMQFYAIFPLLFVSLTRYGAVVVAGVAATLSAIVTEIMAGSFPEPSFILFKLPIFVSGMLLCLAARDASLRRRGPCIALALTLALTQFQNYGYQTIWVFLLTALVALSSVQLVQHSWLSVTQSLLRKILDNRPMAVAAELSYSV